LPGQLTRHSLVTHQSKSPTWLSRRSKHRVWLKDIQLYVFCDSYHQENMRQNKLGAFEIRFVKEEGMLNFHFYFKTVVSLALIVSKSETDSFQLQKGSKSYL